MKKKRLHLTTLLCLLFAVMLFITGCKNIGEEQVYYTVTFDSDGGSDVPAQTVESGKTAVEPRSPTKQGHNFVAWYNGNTEFNFKTPVTSDLTLKAKWTPTDSPDDGEGRGDNNSDTGEGSEQDDTTGSGNTTNPDNKDDGDIDDTPVACEVSASQLGTLTSADLAKDEFGDTYTIRLVGAWTNDELRAFGSVLRNICDPWYTEAPPNKHITLDMSKTTGITKLYGEIIEKDHEEDGTFSECTALTAVRLPSTLKTIDEYAFRGCISLKSIMIPDSVTNIDSFAFTMCHSLESVTIGSGAISIGSGPFINCSSINSITVASGNPKYHSKDNCLIETATKIVVAGCANSKIPSDVTAIGDYAFAYCESLTSITIPNTVTSIGDYAFADCFSLANVTMGNGLKTIGEGAFVECPALTNVTIPDSVTSIKGGAFGECSLENIIIPKNVKYIGIGAFYDCSSTLKSITVVAGNENYYSEGNCLIEKSTGTLITGCANGKIPNSVKIIAYSAFSWCNSLENIEIPDSVTSIEQYAFFHCTSLKTITIGSGLQRIGYDAFRRCNKLETIIFKGTKTEWEAIDKDLYWHDTIPATKVICTDGEVDL